MFTFLKCPAFIKESTDTDNPLFGDTWRAAACLVAYSSIFLVFVIDHLMTPTLTLISPASILWFQLLTQIKTIPANILQFYPVTATFTNHPSAIFCKTLIQYVLTLLPHILCDLNEYGYMHASPFVFFYDCIYCNFHLLLQWCIYI